MLPHMSFRGVEVTQGHVQLRAQRVRLDWAKWAAALPQSVA